MPAGRPTDYTPELVEKARDYLETYESTYEHRIPSVAGLAKVLGKSRDTLYDWAKQEDKQEFSNILRQIVSNQEFVLLDKGLGNEFNAAITKLALGKHGYHEKQDRELSGPGGGPVENKWTVEFINASFEGEQET